MQETFSGKCISILQSALCVFFLLTGLLSASPARAQSLDPIVVGQDLGRQLIAQSLGIDPLTIATQTDLDAFITSYPGGTTALSTALSSALNVPGVTPSSISTVLSGGNPVDISGFLGSSMIPSLTAGTLTLTQISQLANFSPDLTSMLAGGSGSFTPLIQNALSIDVGLQTIGAAFGIDPSAVFATIGSPGLLNGLIGSYGGIGGFSATLSSALNIPGIDLSGISGALMADPLSIAGFLGDGIVPSLFSSGISIPQIQQMLAFNPDFSSILSGFSPVASLEGILQNVVDVDLGLQTIGAAFGLNSSAIFSTIGNPALLTNFVNINGGISAFSNTLTGVLNMPSITSGITTALSSGIGNLPSILGSQVSSVLQGSGLTTGNIIGMLSSNPTFGNEIIGGLSSGNFNFSSIPGTTGVLGGTTTSSGSSIECADQYFVNDTGKTHMAIELEEDRRWMFEDVFIGHILPSMMMMTHQLTAVAMQQVFAMVPYFDAWTQMESQRLIQQLQAQAHKDYHPSEGICEVATIVRSLANSDRNRQFNTSAFSQYMLERQAGQGDVGATEGRKEDRRNRVMQYTQTYCDDRDNNTAMQNLCDGTAASAERKNKDLDYNRILLEPETLDVDFLDNAGVPTEQEQDLFTMTSNLFAPEVLTRIPKAYLKDPPTTSGDTQGNPLQANVLEAQSLVAKRSVAQNSINAIVGMKAEASMKYAPTEPDFPSDQKGAEPYLYAFLRDLGFDETNIKEMIGENPSYYAYMGILTKKIYQNPEFYINLYDKPANVARKRVALKAIELMQDRDIFQSQLRTEATMSVLLEMAVQDSQSGVANQEGNFTGEGPRP
ncbi:MAG: hypothetical protein H6862_04225 [Rhodospirillales bacterium]|nr:hypothetical protein [Rhodospirillales bacterium]